MASESVPRSWFSVTAREPWDNGSWCLYNCCPRGSWSVVWPPSIGWCLRTGWCCGNLSSTFSTMGQFHNKVTHSNTLWYGTHSCNVTTFISIQSYITLWSCIDDGRVGLLSKSQCSQWGSVFCVWQTDDSWHCCLWICPLMVKPGMSVYSGNLLTWPTESTPDHNTAHTGLYSGH